MLTLKVRSIGFRGAFPSFPKLLFMEKSSHRLVKSLYLFVSLTIMGFSSDLKVLKCAKNESDEWNGRAVVVGSEYN